MLTKTYYIALFCDISDFFVYVSQVYAKTRHNKISMLFYSFHTFLHMNSNFYGKLATSLRFGKIIVQCSNSVANYSF